MHDGKAQKFLNSLLDDVLTGLLCPDSSKKRSRKLLPSTGTTEVGLPLPAVVTGARKSEFRWDWLSTLDLRSAAPKLDLVLSVDTDFFRFLCGAKNANGLSPEDRELLVDKDVRALLRWSPLPFPSPSFSAVLRARRSPTRSRFASVQRTSNIVSPYVLYVSHETRIGDRR